MKNFHGGKKQAGFFEGWYLKHQRGDKTIALIPGFHRDESGRPSAFLQIAADSGSWTVNYKAEDFHVHPSRFALRLGKNVFTERGIRLDVQTPGLSCRGILRYGRFAPPKYDIMGPFHYVPFLECNHGVLSLYHRIDGSVGLNGVDICFDGGRGYIEKDWGCSFPGSYLWIQSNGFEEGKCCVMLSIADVPFLRKSFQGCICSILYQGREYRLATYKGVRVLRCEKDRVVLMQGKYLLRVSVEEKNARELLAPDRGRMSRTIRESVSCPARFIFSENGKTIFDYICENTSYEFVAK